MARIVWHEIDRPLYETGLDRGVYFGATGIGAPWNGLVSVSEDSEKTTAPIFIDGQKVRNRSKFGNLSAVVEAYGGPELLSTLVRNFFGMSYRVQTDKGYKIVILYNVLASPEGKTRSTINSSADLVLSRFAITTINEEIDPYRRSARIIIDSSECAPGLIEAIEDILYGDASADSRLPSVSELMELFDDYATLVVTNHHDGSATITGPDEAVYENEDGSWTITWPSVIQIDEVTYEISSL